MIKRIDFLRKLYNNKSSCATAQIWEVSFTMDKDTNKNITIADVAEALGVSKTTVSRAISGKGRIGKETRDRVLAYIEEHDYKPNAIAKGLAQSKTYNICVVMPGNYEIVDWNFFQTCLFGIQEVAEVAGYDILLTTCNMNDISSLERIIANGKVDGVVLMRTFLEDAQIEFLQQKHFPFVTTGSTKYENVAQIDHDHTSITARAFEDNTKIEKVVIPGTIEKIGNFAFQDCSNLKEVVLNEGIKEIGDSSFWGCGITTITIPDSVETIYHYAFFRCHSLEEVVIGSGLKDINNGTFNASISV